MGLERCGEVVGRQYLGFGNANMVYVVVMPNDMLWK